MITVVSPVYMGENLVEELVSQLTVTLDTIGKDYEINIFKWLFRFSGLLLILALFKYNKRFIYILPFIVFALTISTLSFSTIEFRWFIGYDFYYFSV